jgi:2-(1,2-epoxy-1,2-dihydrophenyl)acetyl-CoA isomerase
MAQTNVATERKGRVGIIWLDDPATLNAMDLPMVDGIQAALDSFADARAVVIAGRGRAFCSGGKLSGEGLASAGDEEGPDVGATLETHINPLMNRLRDLPVPWIAAVRGAAAGVGCALALAADMVVAGEKAYFLQAFSGIGLVPDGGSSYLITRAAGRVRAMEMMLLAERIYAAQARDWGLVNRVVADNDVESTALELAERLAAGPTRSLAMIRRLVWSAGEAGWSETLALERALQRDAGRTADFAEGVRAFIEKRRAVFSGV